MPLSWRARGASSVANRGVLTAAAAATVGTVAAAAAAEPTDCIVLGNAEKGWTPGGCIGSCSD